MVGEESSNYNSYSSAINNKPSWQSSSSPSNARSSHHNNPNNYNYSNSNYNNYNNNPYNLYYPQQQYYYPPHTHHPQHYHPHSIPVYYVPYYPQQHDPSNYFYNNNTNNTNGNPTNYNNNPNNANYSRRQHTTYYRNPYNKVEGNNTNSNNNTNNKTPFQPTIYDPINTTINYNTHIGQGNNNSNPNSPSKLPRIIFQGELIVVRSEDEVKGALAALFRDGTARDHGIGFDMEWKPNFGKGSPRNPTSLIQLSTDKVCVIFWMMHLNNKMPLELFEVLASPDILKIGQSLDCGDNERLSQDFQLYLTNTVDISLLAKKKGFKKTNLKEQTRVLLGKNLSKFLCTSNWADVHLTPAQIRYAATDPYVTFLIYHKLMELPDAPVEAVAPPYDEDYNENESNENESIEVNVYEIENESNESESENHHSLEVNVYEIENEKESSDIAATLSSLAI